MKLSSNDQKTRLTGNDYLQFTCETWNPRGRSYKNETKNVSTIIDNK